MISGEIVILYINFLISGGYRDLDIQEVYYKLQHTMFGGSYVQLHQKAIEASNIWEKFRTSTSPIKPVPRN